MKVLHDLYRYVRVMYKQDYCLGFIRVGSVIMGMCQ